MPSSAKDLPSSLTFILRLFPTSLKNSLPKKSSALPMKPSVIKLERYHCSHPCQKWQAACPSRSVPPILKKKRVDVASCLAGFPECLRQMSASSEAASSAPTQRKLQ